MAINDQIPDSGLRSRRHADDDAPDRGCAAARGSRRIPRLRDRCRWDIGEFGPIRTDMEILRELNDELLRQPFARGREEERIEACRRTAAAYALTEGAIAVLSDLETDRSLICYGTLAETLGIAASGSVARIGSIWEEELFGRIHPDDLIEKQLYELRFFRMLKHRSEERRRDYCLIHPLRMRDRTGRYRPVVHRIFYLAGGDDGCTRIALCLYNAAGAEPSASRIVHLPDGRSEPLGRSCGEELLSAREREVLLRIEAGDTSKEIARNLSISVHTVSRHRQNILEKLQAGNSVEASRTARRLGLLR